jgi:hypothetical protein
MSNQQLDDEPPVSPKKTYAFGTPDHGKFPFSSFSHLGSESISFAKTLAANAKPRSQVVEGEGEDKEKELKERRPVKKTKKKAPPVDQIPGLDLPEAEKGQPPCSRIECKDVIADILETSRKNQEERDQIVEDCQRMIMLQQELEEETMAIESLNKSNIMEYNILEGQLMNLEKKCQAKEAAKLNFDAEKDEKATKVMHLELEKQRCARRAVEIQAALGEVMWKGSTDLLKETTFKSNLYIEPFNQMSFLRGDNPSAGSYVTMAKDSLLDFSERTISVPVLNSQLRSSTMSFGSTYNSMSSSPIRGGRTRADGGLSSFNSTTSEITFQSRRNLPSSPLSKLKNRSTGTLRKQAPNGGYRGYTPSGSTRISGAGRTRASTGGMNLIGDDDSSFVSSLDPVFYMERARTSWGRDAKLGKVRLRDDPPGYRRKMLTSLGHPGAYHSDSVGSLND